MQPPTRPELLSPAGDSQAMRAAVANGADAVYFGLTDFSARQRAENFAVASLPATVEYLHSHNVRAYLTLNTLIFSDELDDLARLIPQIAQAGVDAVIVQDVGLARLVHRMCPSLPLHASTQMTLTEPRGIGMLRDCGIRRVILARELSIAEIERIAAATDVELEVFVHGSLCIAYSGQCLTSESVGGRSANRGQCAQACRLPYDLIVDGQERRGDGACYLLSPQDLGAWDLVHKLVRAGVAGLKIEGRLKSAHYVAAATAVYRAAIDAAVAGRPFALSPAQYEDLAQSFSRGFCHGFLEGPNHQALVHARFAKSRGVRVGCVCGRSGDWIIIEPADRTASMPLRPGDGIVFDEGHPEQDEQGGRVVAAERAGPDRIRVALLAGDVNVSAIARGATVWKTDDPALRRRLEHTWSRDTVWHRSTVDFEVIAAPGRPLCAIARDDRGHRVELHSDVPLAAAERHPLDERLLRKQFGRLGNTPFAPGTVQLRGPDGAPAPAVMAPVSLLNRMRRQLVDELLRMRAAEAVHSVADPLALQALRSDCSVASAQPSGERPALCVLVRTMEQLREVLRLRAAGAALIEMVHCDVDDASLWPDAVAAARAAAAPVSLATPRVLKCGEEPLLRRLAECAPDAVLVRNIGAMRFFREHFAHLPLLGDYSLNVANELAAAAFVEAGLRRLVPSYDLNWPQLAAMLRRFPPALFEVVIHQHMPMFHMEHCVFAHTLSRGRNRLECSRPCRRHTVELRDRTGQLHPLHADVCCRNTVFNARAQSAAEYVARMVEMGVRQFRVELLRHSPSQCAAVIEAYRRLLAGESDGRSTWRAVRAVGGVGLTRGTLRARQ